MMKLAKKKKQNAETFKFRQSLFWDVDPKTINPDKHAPYIIERILDLGNDQEVRWMWKRYTHDIISHVVMHRRGLHPATRPLWKALTRAK